MQLIEHSFIDFSIAQLTESEIVSFCFISVSILRLSTAFSLAYNSMKSDVGASI